MMFGKSENKLNSFLGSQCEYEGNLKVKGILRIDGTVKGKIQADRLILSESATVKGELIAGSIVVGGTMEGNLRAYELIHILEKGKVNGDVFTRKFLVDKGAEFNGQIEMSPNGSKVSACEPNILEASAK